MYDLSSKFNTFYDSYVVLPQIEQTNLHNKKNLNIHLGRTQTAVLQGAVQLIILPPR